MTSRKMTPASSVIRRNEAVSPTRRRCLNSVTATWCFSSLCSCTFTLGVCVCVFAPFRACLFFQFAKSDAVRVCLGWASVSLNSAMIVVEGSWWNVDVLLR